MAISAVLLNVVDVRASVDFYTRFLGATEVEVTDDAAVLDVVTATLRLVRVDSPSESTWEGDDLQRGFRHIGFKVADLDARVAALKEAGVRFHLDPIHAEGEVYITFFFDPDGTLVEMVEGPLRYHEVFDQALVDADWGLGDPTRPRFDHVAETVADAPAAHEHFAQHGFVLMAGIHQPSDPRGFEITYVRDGDVSIEVFEYQRAETRGREVQLTAPGYVAAVLDRDSAPASGEVGAVAGYRLFADADGLVYAFGDQ